MLYLVTGATGLVGNNVVRLLLARGDRVRVLARATSDRRPLAGLDVELAQGDVRDAAAVDAAARGVERIVHAAAYVHIGWTQLEQSRAINVAGTANVAASARRAGARLVHVSSVDAMGLPPGGAPSDEDTPVEGGVLCPYVVTKREAEQAVQAEIAQGLDATIVNPAYMIGPWDWKPSSGRMLLEVARNRGVVAPLGTNNYCDVRDVAQGILTAAERGATGRRYILGGERLSYFQAWRVFARVTHALPPLLPAGPLVRIAAGRCGDLWTRLTGRELDVNSAATAIAAQRRNFVSTRAERELDYRPRGLAEAAEAAWQWFREHKYV
ncbi:MAG TPA: NAD-dependent epimerase/dehydratase family protein [Pirellulales bacterium]|nr:NAD-dependent epimerase/dehydratase family protein [Pirellulales bacterium]